ncbi:centrosomal protein of 290 kDa-like [Planococcus citri]|uniref:centrosomal protein of 290 kDa-like n=1 Tax=Planococcus citri TaxID=170843 RepID=UPI0031F81522
MRKDFKTVNSMNEKLKKENYELENSIEKHLDVEDDLKDKLDEETVILENTKEDLDEANLANKKLKKKNIELERSIEQHLKVEADLKKKLDTITKAFNDMEFLGQTELFILRAEKQKYEVDTLKSKDTIEKLRAEVLHEQRKNHSLLKKLSDQSKSSIVRQNEKLKTKLKKKNDVIKVEIEELKIRQKNLKKLLTKLKNKQSRC